MALLIHLTFSGLLCFPGPPFLEALHDYPTLVICFCSTAPPSFRGSGCSGHGSGHVIKCQGQSLWNGPHSPSTICTSLANVSGKCVWLGEGRMLCRIISPDPRETLLRSKMSYSQGCMALGTEITEPGSCFSVLETEIVIPGKEQRNHQVACFAPIFSSRILYCPQM